MIYFTPYKQVLHFLHVQWIIYSFDTQTFVREFKTWGAIFHMFINFCVPVSGQQRNKDSLTQNMLKGILKELIIISFVTDLQTYNNVLNSAMYFQKTPGYFCLDSRLYL